MFWFVVTHLALLVLAAFIPLTWLMISTAVVLLLWPFVLLAQWHCSTDDQRQRLTAPQIQERRAPSLTARILGSLFFLALGILCAPMSVLAFLNPRPDYFASAVLAVGSVFCFGVVCWISRAGPAPTRQAPIG